MSLGASGDPLQRRPPPPIPILLLTGFLGAGKTTLLNGWIRSGAFADAAVIINEFGEIGIDHLLVEKAEGTMMTLSSGCLCCTVRGDLVSTLEDLIRRRDNGRVTPFNRLVIETTGLADPAPILNTIMVHPYLPLRYRVDGVVTVVDGLHGFETLAQHDEARKQAAVADTLVVTKADLVPDKAAQRALLDRLTDLAPGARLLDAAAGEASADAVLRNGLFDLDSKGIARDWLDPATYAEAHHHHDHGQHHHGHDHRHDGITSFCLTSETALDPASFQMFIDLVRAKHGAALLRVKGLVALTDAPARPLVIHGVQHFFHPPHPLAAWPDGDHRSRLVFIVKDLDPAAVEALWAAFFGAPALDRPDAAAMMESASARRGGLFG